MRRTRLPHPSLLRGILKFPRERHPRGRHLPAFAFAAALLVFAGHASGQINISIAATDAAASEAGPDTGTWTITRSGTLNTQVTVYFTMSGSAETAGSVDYTLSKTGSVTLNNNATTATITLTPVDDSLKNEFDETATLTLTADAAYTIVGSPSDTITIADNDIENLVDPQTPVNAQPASGGTGWALAFSDEFNATTLDTGKWGVDVSTSSRAARTDRGIADWWWKADHVSLNGTDLVIDVSKFDSDTMYCGSISSDGIYEPTYGYLEARVQIADTSKDTHTAFWTQGSNMGNVDGSGNDGAEVDIFESAWTGDYTKSVVHIDGYGAGKAANTVQYSTPGLHSGYHVFGLEWTASSMKIYYDGVLKVTYTGKWVPQVGEYLWLSNGASFGTIGTFSSEPIGWLTSSKWDYVRVWKSVPTYSVTYNGNGNTGGAAPVDSNAYIEGASANVATNSGGLTKFGHVFAGWNTQANGGGDDYAAGSTYTIGTGNVTLYAKWTPVTTYTLTVNSGSGDGNYGAGDVVAIVADAAAANYRFAGWTTTDGGSFGDASSASTTYTMPTNTAAVTATYVLNNAPVVNAGPDQTEALSSASAWSPASLDLAAWYDVSDASTITHSAGAVSEWRDKTDNGRDLVQATPGSQPLYSSTSWNGSDLPSITFDGTDDFLQNAVQLSQPTVTLAAVFDQTGTNNADRIFGIRGSSAATKVNFGLAYDNSLRYDGAYSGSSVAGSTGKHLRVATRTTSTQTGHVDGVQTVTSSTALPNVDGWLNAGAVSSGSEFAPGKLSEAVAIFGTISDQDREKLEGYLAHKWFGAGASNKLPDGHPYKNDAPGGPSASVLLSGGANDADGDAMTYLWSVVSGPDTVTFDNAGALNATATFTVAGEYVLRLTADDGVNQGSSDVTIIINGPASGLYTAWAGGSFAHTFSIQGINADPDGDGILNLVEFAFGLDPTVEARTPMAYVTDGDVTTPGLPVLIQPDGTFEAVFTRHKDHVAAGLTYEVQFSADLAAWTGSSNGLQVVTGAGSSGDYEAVSVPFPPDVALQAGGTAAPQFFRVEVSMD